MNGIALADLEAYVDAAARVVALPLADAHRPGVVLAFHRLAASAALVEGFALPPDVEAAPRYDAQADAAPPPHGADDRA
jgi:hypothetical protein